MWSTDRCLADELDVQVLAMLAKFKSKLQSEQQKNEEELPTTSWMSHKLVVQKEDEGPVLAKDANKLGEGDWYDIYDPRNPINQRRAAQK